MARPKKYKIKLTDDELKELKSVIRKNRKTSKQSDADARFLYRLTEEENGVASKVLENKI